MAFLKNPSFEAGTAPWAIIKTGGGTATFTAAAIGGLPAYSGNQVGLLQTFNPNASVGQDAQVPAGNQAVLCSAFIASLRGGITGKLILTNLTTNATSTQLYNIQTAYAWQSVAGTLDLNGDVASTVRVEFVLDNGFGNQLCVDFVNLS